MRKLGPRTIDQSEERGFQMLADVLLWSSPKLPALGIDVRALKRFNKINKEPTAKSPQKILPHTQGSTSR